jgi:S-(hydroxymethyl)glutathione dehydrogenase/alcohol dehydrogenase
MRTRAALLRQVPGEWEVCDVELDEPREHEVLVRMGAAGLCHSDDHFATGDIPVGRLPFCGGHEGAGVIEAVGPGVRGLAAGDHVVTSFIPGCGRCRWCASGQQNLCDNGALMLHGCGVPTGWGSAVNAAAISPGDVVIVMGVGGIGVNAVQGARHAGASRIIAVDPSEFKREMAMRVGATDALADISEAAGLARSLTNGQGADAAVICVGVLKGEHVAAAFAAIRKAGTLVVTAAASVREVTVSPLSLLELTMYQKRIQGAIYGMMSPSKDVPRLLGLWRNGQLRLEELVSQRYELDAINKGYADLHAGRNIRGLVVFGEG